jgi:hypothetical protein
VGYRRAARREVRLRGVRPHEPHGELRWHHQSGTPLLAVLASPRLEHVLLQSELETFALREDGEVAWRAAHTDVVAAAELVGGRLVLTSYGGLLQSLDPVTGRSLDRA